jgi:hypothetical protein
MKRYILNSEDMNIIDNYNKALQKIYDHVGFKESWVIYPIDDCTDMFWSIIGSSVKYVETIDKLNSEKGEYYQDDIYPQRFYDKWIYKGESYTMVFCDSHVDGVDGMKYFRIFDNSKEIKE